MIKALFYRWRYEVAVLLFLILSQFAFREMLFFVMLLLVGLPHGAADILILKSRSRGWAGFLGLCTLYMALALGMFGLWWVLPNLFWILAFGLAVWHFLKIEWSLRETSLFVPDLAFVAILGIPLVHRESFSKIAEPLRAQQFAQGLLAMESWILGLCVVLLIWRMISYPNRLRHLFFVAAFATVLLTLPLWSGFACFFILLHSARHLELSFQRVSDLNAKSYWGILVPISAACLVPVFMFVSEFDQFIPFAALMLLCLTLPHLIVEALLLLTPTSTCTRTGIFIRL